MMTFKKEHSNFARIKQEPEETITVTTSSEGLFEVLLRSNGSYKDVVIPLMDILSL